MKLGEYLAGFKGFNKNLEVVFSSDEEGNFYGPVVFLPSKGHFNEEENFFIDSESMKDERRAKPINAVCVN